MFTVRLPNSFYSVVTEAGFGAEAVLPAATTVNISDKPAPLILDETALKIKFEVLRLQDGKERITYKDLATRLGLSTRAISACSAKYPELAPLLKAVLPLTSQEKIELKIEEYQQMLERDPEHLDVNAKIIYTSAGVSEKLFFKERSINPEFAKRVDDFVWKVKAHNRHKIYAKIESVILKFEADYRDFSDINIAEEAGITKDAFCNFKKVNPKIAERIDSAVAAVPARRFKYAIEQLNAQGLEVSQRQIADFLEMSPTAVNRYKNSNPAVADLLADAIPLSGRERVRRAIVALQAEKLPINRSIVAKKAGVNSNTVSKVLQYSPDLKPLLPVIPPFIYSDRLAVETEFKARIAKYGSEKCNSAKVLDQAIDRGGNRALLRACRRLGIEMPVFEYEKLTWLTSYAKAITATKPLSENEAMQLWQAARTSEGSGNELFLRLRPIIKSVIEEDLREDFDPTSFKLELIESLVAQGDQLLLDFCKGSEIAGSVIGAAKRQVREGLWTARNDYYKQKNFEKFRQISMQAPMSGASSKSKDSGDTFTIEDTLSEESKATQSANLEFTEEMLGFDEDVETPKLIARRDAHSGLPMISALDKQSLASSLRQIFADKELRTALSSNTVKSLSVMMTGSCGRLGSAIRNQSNAEIFVIVDAVEFSAKLIVERLATLLNARISEDGLSCYLNKSVMRNSDVNSLPTKLRRRLAEFNLDQAGPDEIMQIKFISSEQLRRKTNESLALLTESLFHLLKNGINIFESTPGAQRSIAASLTKLAPEATELAQSILDFTAEFLIQQREVVRGALKQ